MRPTHAFFPPTHPPIPPPGLVEFYSDLLPNKPPRDLSLYCLTLLPPLLLAILDPGMFLSALDIVGTYGISLLFGILPALFAFQLRYPTYLHITYRHI
jgi:tyrosine-specific transport protein